MSQPQKCLFKRKFNIFTASKLINEGSLREFIRFNHMLLDESFLELICLKFRNFFSTNDIDTFFAKHSGTKHPQMSH